MKIVKLKAENFRLLKDFELSLENELSLIIGKNNCGKTSLLSLLGKFLSAKPTSSMFSYDDFNIGFQKALRDNVVNGTPMASDVSRRLSLKVFIEYSDADSLANIKALMLDLDPCNNMVVLLFEYVIAEPDFSKLHSAFIEYRTKKKARVSASTVEKIGGTAADVESGNEALSDESLFNEFMQKKHRQFFRIFRKSISYDIETKSENESEYRDLDKDNVSLKGLLNFQAISAKREVSNKDSNKTLSNLASKYYENKEKKAEESPEIESFKDALSDTDKHLNTAYGKIFHDVIEKVKRFGGIKAGDSQICVNSTLEHKNLLKDNTTVAYNHDGDNDFSLPENYNGLGYLNLISMIFEIEVRLHDFQREEDENEPPAEINLLFIEEPEAHTHPQMQYVFIKNIKDILRNASEGKSGPAFNLQTIITTHSSHIAAESSFDDIKFFTKNGMADAIISKNLTDLKQEYIIDEEQQHFRFLKQYLTLNRAELFFADKAILVEGDTERILLPAMMKKIDQNDVQNETPLLSQNISIVEVGAYSQIFEKFIDFIGIKCLIITDIDSGKENENKRIAAEPVATATHSSNTALKFFLNGCDFKSYLNRPLDQRSISKDPKDRTWKVNKGGHVLICYQMEEKNAKGDVYYARSFEDAFFHLNRKFISDSSDTFAGLKNREKLEDDINSAYTLARECVDKKPSFALDILLHSIEDDETNLQFSNWITPAYISEGLLWLKQN
ncbi:MAG: ATP-dependent endonuclease [Deltaproteobacteria bacterium]|nr:ATP-dependent endonuclease [Deltaproteobacteria bacterium]